MNLPRQKTLPLKLYVFRAVVDGLQPRIIATWEYDLEASSSSARTEASRTYYPGAQYALEHLATIHADDIASLARAIGLEEPIPVPPISPDRLGLTADATDKQYAQLALLLRDRHAESDTERRILSRMALRLDLSVGAAHGTVEDVIEPKSV